MAIDISKFKNCKVLVVGDYLIDEYIWGSVENVSTEAPVPIVSVKNYNYELGGAGNVVSNLRSLGASVYALGLAGTDYNGKLLMEKLDEQRVDVRGMYIDNRRPTTKKTRIVASNQQVLRVDWDTVKPISKTAQNELVDSAQKIIPKVDIVLISDHGSGMLSKTFLETLFSIAKKNNKITILDPCGTDYNKYVGATIITPNSKEVSLATGIDIIGKSSTLKGGTELLKTSRAEGLLVTCGKDGIIIFGRDAHPFEIEAQARQVYDVAGASDTVLALLGLSLASGGTFKDAATVANVAAGIVVGKFGAATVTEKEIILELMTFSGVAKDDEEEREQKLY